MSALRRPGRGRPTVGDGPGTVVPVRLDAPTLAALDERARADGLANRSEAIRAAVLAWTHSPPPARSADLRRSAVPAPVYADSAVRIETGDCLDVMRTLPDRSVDAITTDPPYGLGIARSTWDSSVPGVEWARECLRVLRPGGHLIACGHPRTWHRLVTAIEDGGFEVRDCLAWLHGNGMPQSKDVSRLVDHHLGIEREVTRAGHGDKQTDDGLGHDRRDSRLRERRDDPATDEAAAWTGWGTMLRPSFEPIVVARKPFSSTLAANVLAHGTGAMNLGACRTAPELGADGPRLRGRSSVKGSGRWPANVLLDEKAAATLEVEAPGSSAFFYTPKPGPHERVVVDGVAHPTVKPLALVRWMVRLVTPPGGLVLDPYAGSGTTVEACLLEGFRCLAVEADERFLPLIQARVARAAQARPDTVRAVPAS